MIVDLPAQTKLVLQNTGFNTFFIERASSANSDHYGINGLLVMYIHYEVHKLSTNGILCSEKPFLVFILVITEVAWHQVLALAPTSVSTLTKANKSSSKFW